MDVPSYCSCGRTVADELFDAVDVIPLGQGIEGAEEFLKVFSVPNEYAIRGAYGEAKALQEILEDGDVIESVFDWVRIPRVSINGLDFYQRVQGVDQQLWTAKT